MYDVVLVAFEGPDRYSFVGGLATRMIDLADALVGRGYFVQTPHRGFPIEAHTWLPFVGWLPHDATVRVVRVSDRYWVKHCGYVDWNLLGEADMRRLFPDAEIVVERVLGLPKSLVAYKR